MQVNDIVKWVNAFNYSEKNDIMIVTSESLNNMVQVIHINEKNSPHSIEFINDIRIVGHMNPSDNYQDIINKFKNK